MNAYIINTGALTTPLEIYLNEVVSKNVVNIYCYSGCYRVGSDDLGVKLRYLRILVGTLAVPPSPPQGQPAKRARTDSAKASNHSRASPPRKVRGRLSELPTMPMDILFEVCNMRLVVLFATSVIHGNCSDFHSPASLGPAFGQSREQGFSRGALVSQLFVFVECMLEVLRRPHFSS